VEGRRLEVLPEEVEVRLQAHTGLEAAAEGPYVAALQTELNESLLREGLVRELVRRIQDQRKEAGLDLADRIHLSLQAGERLAAAVREHRAHLMAETLAVSLVVQAEAPAGAVKHSLEAEQVWVSIEKAAQG